MNDVLLSCVAGALRDYLEEKGDDTEGIELRAMVPVNLRPIEQAGKLGNHFGLVALELPVGMANPLARLYELRRRMLALKGSYQAILSLGLLAAVGMGPKVLQEKVLGLMSSKGTAVMTNVPGAKDKRYLAGVRIEQQMFWVPQSGNIGMGVSILSYGGGVQFGLITDQALCPDPAIIGRFAEEFDKLLLLTLMEPGYAARGEEVEVVQPRSLNAVEIHHSGASCIGYSSSSCDLPVLHPAAPSRRPARIPTPPRKTQSSSVFLSPNIISNPLAYSILAIGIGCSELSVVLDTRFLLRAVGQPAHHGAHLVDNFRMVRTGRDVCLGVVRF